MLSGVRIFIRRHLMRFTIKPQSPLSSPVLTNGTSWSRNGNSSDPPIVAFQYVLKHIIFKLSHGSALSFLMNFLSTTIDYSIYMRLFWPLHTLIKRMQRGALVKALHALFKSACRGGLYMRLKRMQRCLYMRLKRMQRYLSLHAL